MNISKLVISVLTFLTILLMASTGYLTLSIYALTTSADVRLPLGIPGLALTAPNVAHAAVAQPRIADTRQFSLFLTMIKDAQGGEHHRWVPNVMVVNQGDTIIVRTVNTDANKAHGFGIVGYGVFDSAIPPGTEKTFEFVADKPGIFHFICAAAQCAADHGDQEGQLVVLAR
jgi:heme/copper-type cytochrome/quinol oxidase subunit 2